MEWPPRSILEIAPALVAAGLTDFAQLAFTDDRSAGDTLRRTTTRASRSRPDWRPGIAIQCVTINLARHMRLTTWVGSLANGRYADIVLPDDVAPLGIAEMWADAQLVADITRDVGPLPEIDCGAQGWPGWQHVGIHVGRSLTAGRLRHSGRGGTPDDAGGGAPPVPLGRRRPDRDAAGRAPYPLAPDGFVNVRTGQTHAIVWCMGAPKTDRS